MGALVETSISGSAGKGPFDVESPNLASGPRSWILSQTISKVQRGSRRSDAEGQASERTNGAVEGMTRRRAGEAPPRRHGTLPTETGTQHNEQERVRGRKTKARKERTQTFVEQTTEAAPSAHL